ncbi:MAG: IPT/TIG domain-containing protein [Vicinamibacterales bacterium]
MTVRVLLRGVAPLLWLSASLVACGSSPMDLSATGADQPAPQVSSSASPSVATMTPTSGPVGTTVTITGAGFERRNNTATFGQGYIRQLDSTDGATITFTVPDGLDLCPPDTTTPCAGAVPRTKPGDYVVAVMIDGKKSNALTFTVTP